MKPIALVPVAVLFAGTAAFAAGNAGHPSSTGSSNKPAVASPAASPDGGNSAAAHSCPKGPHGVHGKCVSAAAHARNAARGHGNGQGDAGETPDAGESPEANPTAPAHPTPPPHPTAPASAAPSATPPPTPTPTAVPSGTPSSSASPSA